MARRFILADDLDGTESTDENPVLTWTFSVGPRNNPETYSIDLTEKNYNELLSVLDPYVKVAEPIKGGAQPRQAASEGSRRGRGPNRTPEEIEQERKAKEDRANQREEIVAWGLAQNKDGASYKVNESGRGRLDGGLISAFYEAHKDAERFFS